MIVQGHDITGPRSLRTHTLVVGSGSGGGVAAYHLAEAGVDTIVVEEGGYHVASEFNQREEDMEIQVEAEANQYIPFAMDEVNLDFQIIGPAPSGADEVEVLIAASRKEKVEDRVAVADAAGLKTVIMDVDSYATLEAFGLIAPQLPANGRDQNIAIVDIGAHMMHFYVIRNGQQLFSREQAFGGNQLTQDIHKK